MTFTSITGCNPPGEQPTPRRSPSKAVCTAVVVFLAALSSGCSSGGFPASGKVVDAETNQPIANVWVVQEWRLRDRFAIPFTWDQIRTFSCREGHFAKTDAQGNFRFDAPTDLNSSWFREAYAAYDALLVGYAEDTNRSGEAVSYWSASEASATVVVREQAMTDDQIEDHAFSQMVSAGRCGFRPVPEGLKQEMRAFLVSRGMTQAKLVDRMVKSYSMLFNRPVSEREVRSSETFVEQREALKFFE